MTVVQPSDNARDAVEFWSEVLDEPVSEELSSWISDRTHDLHFIWRDVRRMLRSREMWKAMSEQLELRDPTSAWTRNYDGLYFDSQLLSITRSVHARNQSGHISLGRLLGEFAERPEMLGPVVTYRNLPEIAVAVDPLADKAHLGRQLRHLKTFRDKVVAHTERGADVPTIQWEDLDEAVDVVSEVFRRYSMRLTGINWKVEYDEPYRSAWKSIFTEPLFTDGENGQSPRQ